MAPSLSVAVIGCGRMGAHTSPEQREKLPPGWWPNNHADAAAAVPGLRLVAFCDTDRVAAESAATRHGGKIYTDYRAILSDCVPDIVTIATRTEGRAQIIADLAAAGVRAIHSEKPLCRNLREGKTAAAAVESNGVAFSYGATRRYMAAYRQAKEIVLSGRFGAREQMHFHFGAGALQWTHPHCVDLAMFFADDRSPESAQAAFLNSETAQGNVLDADPVLAMGLLRFREGMSAGITLAGGCDTTIACSDGLVSVLSDGEIVECRTRRHSGDPYFGKVEQRVINPPKSGLEIALTELRDSLLENRAPSSGIHQALTGQRALFALALSGLRNGAEVKLSDVPDDFTVTGRKGNLYA